MTDASKTIWATAIAQARREGWEAAKRAAVALCVDASKKSKIWRDAAQKDCAEHDPYHDGEFQQAKRSAFDIQALEYKEPET